MKIIQSFWSRPMSVMHPFTGGWPEVRYYWYAWILSTHQAKTTHQRVELVADREGARLLVDNLGLPFDRVDISLDQADAHPGLWKYGKMMAYAAQDEPFLHIESDVFLWKRLPDELLNAPMLVQQIELPWHDHFDRDIDSRYESLTKSLRNTPKSWETISSGHEQTIQGASSGARILHDVTQGEYHESVLCDDQRPLNVRGALHCGVFGGHDLDAIHQIAREVRGVVELPENRVAWLAMRGGTPVERGTYPNVLLEHYTAFAVAVQRGVDLWTVFPPGTTASDTMHLNQIRAEALGFTHVMEEKATALESGLAERLERRVKYQYPEHYDRVQRLIERQQIKPSKTRQAGRMMRAATRAATSVARTKIAGRRLPDEAYQKRLMVCQQCPGGYVTKRRGEVYSCGPMLASIKGKLPTCGCFLKSKARDPKEDCPMGYWPKENNTVTQGSDSEDMQPVSGETGDS